MIQHILTQKKIFFLIYSILAIVCYYVIDIRDTHFRLIFSIFIFIFIWLYTRRETMEEKILAFLVGTAFLPKIHLTVLGFGAIALFFFIHKLIKKENWNFDKRITLTAGCFFAWMVFSWIFNHFFYEKDPSGIIFWCGTSVLPFAVLFLAMNTKKINSIRLEDLYLNLIFLEIILLWVKAVKLKLYLLQDGATGTCANAHVLGLHIIFGCFILVHRAFLQLENLQTKKKELIYTIGLFIAMNTALIMTDSKAATLLYVFILSVAFLVYLVNHAQIKKQIKIISILVLTLLGCGFYWLSSDFFSVASVRLANALSRYDLMEGADKSSGKIFAYYLIPNHVWKDTNMNKWIGTGPAKYTSKASRMRMSSIADNQIPFVQMPKKKWKIFQEHIFKHYYTGEKSLKNFSWGTSFSPMTSINSIIVELGVIGLLFFMGFLVVIVFAIVRRLRNEKNYYLLPIFSLFVGLLFYLNYWEDPAATIPVFALIGGYLRGE